MADGPAAAIVMRSGQYSAGSASAPCSRSSAWTTFRSPRMGRPSGCSGQTRSAKRSWITSSGVSSTIRNSWRTTVFSRSMSSAANRGTQEDVGEEIGGERQVLVEHRHVEAGVLLRGERVHLAAHRVDGPGDLLGRPGLGPLEDQVLDEVGDAALGDGLVAAAGVHPDADGHRADVRDPLGDEPDPVGQDGLPVLALHPRRGARSRDPSAAPSAVPGPPRPVAPLPAHPVPDRSRPAPAHGLRRARVGLAGQVLRRRPRRPPGP